MLLLQVTLDFGLFGWWRKLALSSFVCLLIRCDLSIVFEEAFGVTLVYDKVLSLDST